MNCQEISDILDDQDIAALSDAQRSEVEAHLPACKDCAREWAAHQSLLAVAIPSTPVALAAQCRAGVTAQSHVRAGTQGGRRAGSRLILIGTLAAVAAAAALINAVLRNSDEAPLAAAVISPAAAELAPVVAASPVAVEPAVTNPAPVEPKNKAQPLPESPRFTVRVLPLQDGTRDESSRHAVEAFYAALIDRLREVPGLTLVEADATGKDFAPGNRIAPNEFLLQVTGAGPTQGRWNVRMMLITEMPVTGGPKGVQARVPQLLQYSGVLAPACVGTMPGPLAVDCSDPQGGAALQIDLMRQVAFPADPLRQRTLQARLLDRTLDPQQRWKALQTLRMSRPMVQATGQAPKLSEERPAIDAETLRGALDLAASTGNPPLRAQIWRTLRGARQPELIQPLIDSSRLDTSDATRLEAVATLAADYSQEDRARAALESIALNDSRELVRMVAQRGLSGDAVWNDYATARLQDASLPDERRLEALTHMVASGEVQRVRGLLDDKAVEALAQIMPRVLVALPDPSASRAAERSTLLSLANALTMTNQPATIDLLIGMLRATSDPNIHYMAVAGLAGHRDDARARSSLEEIAAHDADPELRGAAASALRSAVTPPPGT